MKKLFILLVILSCFPAVSFSQQTGSGTVTLGAGGNLPDGTASDTLDVSLSNQVTIVYDGTTHSGDTFALETYHDKGTRLYLSSSEDAKIYYQEAAIPDSAPTVTAPAVGTSMDHSGFKAL